MKKERLREIIKEAILEEVEGAPTQRENPEVRLASFVGKASGSRKYTGEDQAEFLELLNQVSETVRELAKEKTGEEVPEGLPGAWVALENLEDSEIEARLPSPEPSPEGEGSTDAETPSGDPSADPAEADPDADLRRKMAAAGVKDYKTRRLG